MPVFSTDSVIELNEKIDTTLYLFIKYEAPASSQLALISVEL